MTGIRRRNRTLASGCVLHGELGVGWGVSCPCHPSRTLQDFCIGSSPSPPPSLGCEGRASLSSLPSRLLQSCAGAKLSSLAASGWGLQYFCLVHRRGHLLTWGQIGRNCVLSGSSLLPSACAQMVCSYLLPACHFPLLLQLRSNFLVSWAPTFFLNPQPGFGIITFLLADHFF